ncbi:class I SAM-dependent methyltransferase [Streptomyces niveus]|uniref:class I SAM-dependent methyltransferase n=1 Tax=Streptomyces niveus TaxID=193462 RepID=UPI0034224CA3
MTQPTAPTAPVRPTRQQIAAQFDAFHTARTGTGLSSRMYAAAMGEDYPPEIDASSSCDWPLLALMTARLRMRPGDLLMEAGCGTGGIGLWLARAFGARLMGFDLSPVAVKHASARPPSFGLPDSRADFRVAAIESTGLPDGIVHGAVCVDALSFATNRAEGVRELGRVLAPGGRLVLTRALRTGAEPVWETEARAAGLVLEHVDERPHEPLIWERLYRLWIGHEQELRAELGDVQADNMLREAHQKLPTLPGRRAVLLTLRRPPAVPAATARADTMSGPAPRPGQGDPPDERNPQ